MIRALQALALLFMVLAWSLAGPSSARAGDFDDWAVVVVAGDWRSSTGRDTDAFDNARRDLTSALAQAGFAPGNIRQYSLRPRRSGDDPVISVQAADVARGTVDVASRARGGCLFYVTSHGNQHGVVFGPDMMMTPQMLDRLLTEACGTRPTVAIVSACFSGVFVPGLGKPNRMILTAARPDRSSFGCGDRDRYPYFDACMLESLPTAGDFPTLATRVRSCVARREQEMLLTPPSEPMVAMGSQAQLVIPMLRFDRR